MSESAARALAAGRVRAIGADHVRRLALAAELYDRPALRRYQRAELGFLHWEISRGVLEDPDGPRPGSRWWRALNDHLLGDKVEARLLRDGTPGEPSSRAVAWWLEFLAAPSACAWFQAHNASIVGGYLAHEELAADESHPELFMMNVALVRVLFTHVLNADPRLAIGFLAPLGRALGDPRRRFVCMFLDLRRSFPDQYPIDHLSVPFLFRSEGRVAHAVDYGVVTPRLPQLYEFSARTLEEPRVRDLIRDGVPSYGGWISQTAWHDESASPLVRLARALTRRPT